MTPASYTNAALGKAQMKSAKWGYSLALGMLPLAVSGCPVKRVITVRACAVQGVNNPRTLAADATERASKIWWQAEIGFVVLANIPIIPDPQPPGLSLPVPPYIAKGQLGDIRLDDDRGFGSDENEALVNACVEEWRSRGYSSNPQPGMTVVFVRELISTTGGYLAKSGISTEQTSVLGRDASLCSPPYTVAGTDVAGRWSVVETVNNRQFVSLEHIAVVLAHELGHDLLLAHGDGIDNDEDGPWDDYCDNEPVEIPPLAASSLKPLMDPFVVDGYFISPLQAARAGAAADALIAADLDN